MSIQDKFNRKNVIYKITRDIDLGGETLTIPEGCTLDFQGGNLSNGIINGNNTKIVAGLSPIFSNIIFSGTYIIDNIYAEWFNSTNNIQEAIYAARKLKAPICLLERVYNINETLTITDEDNKLIIQGVSTKAILKTDLNIPIMKSTASYAIFRTLSFIGPNKADNESFGLLFESGYNNVVENCRFSNLGKAIQAGCVSLLIFNSYIFDNYIGFTFCKKNNISTCIKISDSIFTGNDIGVSDVEYDDKEATQGLNVGTAVKTIIDNTIFEVNGIAFKLRNQRFLTIGNCWFERNTEPSMLFENYVFLHKNIFSNERPFTNFDISANSYGYGFGGKVRIGDDNVVAKSYKFSNYEDNYKGIDNGALSLRERIKGDDRILTIYNGDKVSGGVKLTDFSSSKIPDIESYAFIRGDGTLYFTNPLIESVVFSDDNEKYVIKLSRTVECLNVIVTPSHYEKFCNSYVGLVNTNAYTDGYAYGRFNRIYIHFKDIEGVTQKVNFSLLLCYKNKTNT